MSAILFVVWSYADVQVEPPLHFIKICFPELHYIRTDLRA
jgi:hypothetical protein